MLTRLAMRALSFANLITLPMVALVRGLPGSPGKSHEIGL